MLIIALGFVASMTNSEPIDLFGLGFGTVGNLFLYLFVVGSLFGSVALVITGLIRGWFGPGPTLVALKVPLLGQTLRLMSLSRMAWSFGMAIDSGMPAKESMHLGLVSSQNAYYQSLEPRIAKSIQDGRSFQESLAETAAFPDDLVDAVEAGEMSGTVTETLERLSNDYRDRAANLFRMITVIGGFMVMGFVMLVVAAAIILIYKRLVIDQYQQLLEF
ncbi:MAG: type II secretion system F family protein [Pirellulaceae bacterium]